VHPLQEVQLRRALALEQKFGLVRVPKALLKVSAEFHSRHFYSATIAATASRGSYEIEQFCR